MHRNQPVVHLLQLAERAGAHPAPATSAGVRRRRRRNASAGADSRRPAWRTPGRRTAGRVGEHRAAAKVRWPHRRRHQGPDTRLRAAAASTRSTAPAPRSIRPGQAPRPPLRPAGTAARWPGRPAPTRRAARRSRRHARARGVGPGPPRAGPTGRCRRSGEVRGSIRSSRTSSRFSRSTYVAGPASTARAPRRTAGATSSHSWRRPLLSAVVGQEDDDAVGFAVAIGAKDERVGGVGPHGHPSAGRPRRWPVTCNDISDQTRCARGVNLAAVSRTRPEPTRHGAGTA